MSDKNTCQEWHPDSDTQIVGKQTIISPISLNLCCIEIAEIMSRPQLKQDRGELIISRLDELLRSNVGAITPSALTLLGKENKAFKNTQNKPKLATIIANEVKLHLDKKLAGEAKKIAFKSIDSWLNKVTAKRQENQPETSQEPRRVLPNELNTKQIKKYFSRAIKAKLMDKQYKWLSTHAQLGYFCLKAFDQPRPISLLETFFNVKKLSGSITQASYKPKRADVIKWRAVQDKKIFFD